MRKILIILCIVFSLSICNVAFAADVDTAPAPQFDPSVTYAESPEFSGPRTRAAGVLNTASNTISRASSLSVTCQSTSIANAVSDSIKVEYVLYQSNGGGWKQYKSVTHTRSRAASFVDSASFSITPGYSYYVKTVHRVYSGNTLVSSATLSSGSIRM